MYLSSAHQQIRICNVNLGRNFRVVAASAPVNHSYKESAFAVTTNLCEILCKSQLFLHLRVIAALQG